MVAARADSRIFVVDVVAKARGINNSESDANAVLLELCGYRKDTSGERIGWHIPTLTGLIRMPSST